jgi:hypothetical protein
MLSYKETLFLSIINETLLTENYSYGDGNFLELLLEAPIPNNTVNKIIKNNKQVTFYYQGDDKLKRSWYPVQVISRKKVGSDNIIKAYVVPKDGSKPYIHDFDQSKIVNWNVLGTAPANLVAKNNASSETPPQKDKADAEKAITAPTTSNISAVVDSDKEMEPEFEKKVVSFMQNDSVPKEKKKSLLGKLKNIGVKLSKGLLKVAVAAGLFYGSLKTPGIDSYVRKLYPNVTQLISPKDLTNKDFTDDQLKALGHVIYNAIERGESPTKGSIKYEDYPSEYAEAIKKGGLSSDIDFINKQITRDPYMMVSTTVGRFIYTQNEDGSYSIDDPWDFSKSPTIKTTAKDLEGLTYPQKISKIKRDNNTTFYAAVRHIASLENPDNDPSFKAKRTVLTIPAKYIVKDYENPPMKKKSTIKKEVK